MTVGKPHVRRPGFCRRAVQSGSDGDLLPRLTALLFLLPFSGALTGPRWDSRCQLRRGFPWYDSYISRSPTWLFSAHCVSIDRLLEKSCQRFLVHFLRESQNSLRTWKLDSMSSDPKKCTSHISGHLNCINLFFQSRQIMENIDHVRTRASKIKARKRPLGLRNTLSG